SCIVLAKYLTADGHTVTTAMNAEEAVACLEGAEFDLLITDHAMPGMNGVNLAAAFREKHAACPVILVSGFAAGRDGWVGTPPGVNLVMQKPVSRRDLRRALMAVAENVETPIDAGAPGAKS